MAFENIFQNNVFSEVIGKRIIKTMHSYKKSLTVALALVFKIFLAMP